MTFDADTIYGLLPLYRIRDARPDGSDGPMNLSRS